jgi:eukaryotic-like serine/threonine-protein kinase
VTRDTPPDPELWRRIEQAFAEATRDGPRPSPEVIAAACGGDVELCRQVEELLRAHGDADAFLAGMARRAGLQFGGDAGVAGRRIGAYRLVREIGRGGMGAVYLAERADDAFEKHVAVKLLPLGQFTAAARERFRTERQILARLEHPGIARLLDGGVAEDGTPFYVMEYVQGEPLTDWCDRHDAPLEARLKLFLQVCDAVDYAHRNLVIHRDIKPANILVRADGQAVLLDFGIARIVSAELDESGGGLTVAVGRPMTVAYASPEQLRGEAISTATDVYALGVLLYELLAGRQPFDVRGLSPSAAERHICTEPVALPSAAAASGGGSAEARARHLRGDLDTMVQMAMRREPDRRYRSAAAFADDVRRFLEGRPVSAQPDRWTYRLRKFAGRRPGALAAAGAAAIAALAFTATLIVSADRLAREREQAELQRDRARVEAAKAGRVSDFLVRLFEAADPAVSRGTEVTANQLLERGLAQIRQLPDAPEVRAELLAALARVYVSLGRFADAQPLAEEALALRRQVFGPVHADVASSLHALGEIERRRGDLLTADRHLQQALAMRRELLGEAHPLVAQSMVSVAWTRDRLFHEVPGLEDMLRRALEIQRAQPNPPREDMAMTLEALTELLVRDRRAAEAEPVREELVRLQLDLMGDDHPGAVDARLQMGVLLRARGEVAAAAEQYRLALQLQQRLGPHPRLVSALVPLAGIELQTGDTAGAEAHLRHALDVARQFRDQDATALHRAGQALVRLLTSAGRLEETMPLYEETIDAALRAGMVANAAGLRLTLSHVQRDLGQLDAAIASAETALRVYRREYDDDYPLTAVALTELARLLHRRGNVAAAERHSREAVAMYRRMLDEEEELPFRMARSFGTTATEVRPPHPTLRAQQRVQLRAGAAAALDAHIEVLLSTGRREEAIAHAREALAAWDAAAQEAPATLPGAAAAQQRLRALLTSGHTTGEPHSR